MAMMNADEAKGKKKGEKGFISLFDGESLKGWKVSKENPKSITVKDGNIVIDGPRAHLFYAGDVADANFKNFVFRAQVKTFPKANSGIYFHTKYQDGGWPDAGFEAQVNNTHGDPKKTGGLYAVKDVNPAPAKDGEWFNYEIRVRRSPSRSTARSPPAGPRCRMPRTSSRCPVASSAVAPSPCRRTIRRASSTTATSASSRSSNRGRAADRG